MAPLILVEHCVLKIIGFKVGFYFGDSISWWKEAKLSTRGAALSEKHLCFNEHVCLNVEALKKR